MGASSVERNALHVVVTTSESSWSLIEIPTAPTTKDPKSETFVTTPGDAEQSTKCQRQKVASRLDIAGRDSRIEISTLTDDQNAFQTAKMNKLLNMDKFCVVGGRQTAIETSSLNTLGIKTETGWSIQSKTCGTRI